jgi:hypothetical protein
MTRWTIEDWKRGKLPGGKELRLSTRLLFVSKLKFFLMVTTGLGVWGPVVADSVKSAILLVLVTMDLKRGLRWRPVGLMSF